MEEKTKRNVLIYIISVVVLSILILICGGIYLYKNIINRNTDVSKETQNQEQINNANNEEKEENGYNGVIKKQLVLNNKNIDIEFNYTNNNIIEEDERGKLYSQEYELFVNGKSIEEIEDGSKYIDTNKQIIGDIFNVKKISDKVTNNEYLVLQVYEDLIAAGPTINVYIIDYQEGRVITKLINDENCSALFLKEKMKKNEEGEYIPTEETQLKMEILDNEIISYEYVAESAIIEKRIYTINRGRLERNLEKTYDTSEIFVVGKSW